MTTTETTAVTPIDHHPFLRPPRLPLVAPSILSADFARLGADAQAALDAGGDLLHVDVMDGHFVPNLSMGPAITRSLARAMPDAFQDVHLMVTDPLAIARSFVDAGAGHLTIHVEVLDDVRSAVAAVRELGVTVGLALNPPTPVDAVLPYVDEVDLMLVMSVNPGFSGQAFIPEVLAKARAIRDVAGEGVRIQIDGGVSPTSAAACRDAGCDVLVAASAIYGTDDYAGAITAIRG